MDAQTQKVLQRPLREVIEVLQQVMCIHDVEMLECIKTSSVRASVSMTNARLICFKPIINDCVHRSGTISKSS